MPYGQDYRQLQAPVGVDTSLPDNGATARAAALGGAFKEFEGLSNDVYTKLETHAGALAGAASGATGSPDYKQGLTRFTAYSQAFNNAATGAYAVQAEAQADDSAARLRVQANNDPGTFSTTYTAVRDAVLKNAPAQAVPMLTELYNKRLAAGMAAISGDQAQQIQQTQRATYDEGVSRLTSRVALLQGSENPQDQLQAQDEHAKLSALIDGGVNSGLYSKAEGQAMQIGAMRTVTAQVFQTQVDRELARPDGDVVTLLDNFRKAHMANLADTTSTPVLSEPEYQKLMQDATTKITEQNKLIAMNKREGKSAEQLKYEAGDVQYTSLLFQGKLTHQLLDIAVRGGDLKPETARSLAQDLMHGDTPTDKMALYRAFNDPNRLDWSSDDVAKMPNISGADKLKLMENITKARDNWEGTQSVKDAKGSISAALKIPPGTPTASLSDTQRRALTDANQDFISRMNALDPAKRNSSAASVAQDVVKAQAQKQAAADAQNYQTGRQTFITQHGPSSERPMDDKAYQARLKQYDDNIARTQAAAKGQ